MRLLVTGLNGTLAPLLATAARACGHEPIGWDRLAWPPGDAGRARAWLDQSAPDAIAHLATGDAAWAGLIAGWAAAHQRPLVFTSTAMVFDHEPDGPHHPADARTARDGYGQGKVACEDAIRAAHPGASIARIGWQIDAARPGNNMLLQLDRWQQDQGEVACSRAWRPACSFMADTVAALLGLVERPLAGVLHLDSNAAAGDSFDRIAGALQQQFGRRHWRLRVHEGYRHDQRLVGGPLALPPLAARLPQLA